MDASLREPVAALVGRPAGSHALRRQSELVNGPAPAIDVVAPAASAAAQTTDTPRRGGVLFAAIAADAPSLDPHQEQTFATLQPVAPLYSTLLQIDPQSYPNVIGDLATEWKISQDGLS